MDRVQSHGVRKGGLQEGVLGTARVGQLAAKLLELHALPLQVSQSGMLPGSLTSRGQPPRRPWSMRQVV